MNTILSLQIRNYEVIEKILKNKKNYGFNIFINDSKLANLPDQTKSFIEVNDVNGEIHDNIISNNTKFELDIKEDIDYIGCAKKLSNVPIEIDTNEEGILPNKLGFLEMYDVGKIEQLNSLTRWQQNNPVQHLASIVGVGKNGEDISIDLHEKFHGPHGLIAGMTGSGKSEFIITYILSMAVNYHPYEVQFILIDYKGGGLAGAFENKTTNVKLPHLVGTITNLDKVEINRSLASLDSELKRRQSLFNQAKELTDESTMDIYKYQKLYREGKLKEPMSHLFIISDEFAELKQQQPEFMEQLIQTARIGRSLGVHLILATQKPSGVVDPQIWSNTRFRVCLRVQDSGDSQEIIKCPDAAYLTQTGRFYFQVGYNEVFVMGQSAYTGSKYYPNEKVVKNIDTTIQLIDNIGYVNKSIDTKDKKQVIEAKGEELSNVVKYLYDLAKQENIYCKPLWLEKIPEFIQVDRLKEKYNFEKKPFELEPIIGEYDVPSMQKQNILTLPFVKGNALIYGAAGSGKENMITTMIYSSMLYNTVDEVNYYVLDFGSESLKMFNSCPLVGDVITPSDDDKVINLFKMINKKIEERKKLFAEYNGDYLTYCKNSGKTLPAIVVVINNYETYQELYEKFDDELVSITRECVKYGIYYVITVNTPNGIRFKLRQNFSQILSLQQNNEDDYITILGNINKMYPSKIFGRGIIKLDGVYEFQTAFACERDNISQFIKDECNKLKIGAKAFAPKVPILPNNVTYAYVKSEIGKDNSLVIGIEKESLEISKFDFIKKFSTLITADDLSICNKMVNALINQILLLRKNKLIVINACEFAIDNDYTNYYQYYDNKFDDIFTEINNKIHEYKEIYDNNGYSKESLQSKEKYTIILIGANDFREKLSDDNKYKIEELFNLSKDLGTFNFIIVDSINQIKKIELESWFKSSTNTDSGIWIGNGINDQFTLKLSGKNSTTREEISDDFCFVLERGKATLVKYLESLPLKKSEKK